MNPVPSALAAEPASNAVLAPPGPPSPTPHRWRRIAMWAGGSVVALTALAALALGAVPASLFQGAAERALAKKFNGPVRIGRVERDGFFSYTPLISLRDVHVGQPEWAVPIAGTRNLLSIDRASTRISVWPLLFGQPFRPRAVHISGLSVNLVRLANKDDNWTGASKSDGEGKRSDGGLAGLEELTVTASRFTLIDQRRELTLKGELSADGARGLTLSGAGTFRGKPANLAASGGRLVGMSPGAPYPFTARLQSRPLTMTVKGQMAGVLNFRDLRLDATAQGDDLKSLDRVIEAGLFSSEPIDLAATVRHKNKDWTIDRLTGSIGRSQLAGHAAIVKHDGRTAITGAAHFSQLDFDDLSNAEGRRKAAALEARIGPRVLPNTRINLAKMGKTDGVIDFKADRLLFKKPSAFQSLRGTIMLDHRKLTFTGARATLKSGALDGSIIVDQRTGPSPRLTVDLNYTGGSLDRLIGHPDKVSGPARGRIRLSGIGDTVRAALSHADGKVALVSSGGTISSRAANVLGQDLWKTATGGDHPVPLRCLVAAFHARGGVLTPAPLSIDTAVSVGRGSGEIRLDGEKMALTLAGAQRSASALRIAEPIRVTGTLSHPAVTIAGLPTSGKPKAESIVRVVTKSIGRALGVSGSAPAPAPAPPPAALNCAGLAAAALRWK